MIERTTVRLPSELLDKARRKAAEQNRTLTALMEDGLRFILEDRPRPARTRRLPRVSSSTGSEAPGIDISDSAALQEIEDLEYVERMKHFK